MQRIFASLLVSVVVSVSFCVALVNEDELTKLLQAESTSTKTPAHAVANVNTTVVADDLTAATPATASIPSLPAVDMGAVVTWMREQGLTTATSVAGYRPDDVVTKQVMAKFASLFAVVMKKQWTTNPNCGFKDIYKAQQDFVPYMLSACSMGLMKGANGYASPTKNLTKAEAVVIIMRIVKNDIKVSGDPRYKSYYEAARAYGITYASLDDMESNVTKGEIAIMMWRAYKIKN